MVYRIVAVVGSGLALTLGAATPASAADTAPLNAGVETPRRLQHTLEVQGVAATQLLPHTHFGGEAAYVLGTETFSARFGGQVLGGRAFELGDGKIGNVLSVFTLDGCGSRQVFRHRVRMCVGGQGGAMVHQWHDYDRPGRKATPWVAGVLRGDYRYSVTERLGLMFGVGVTLPVVGPEFRATSANGRVSPLVFPGPVTGMLTFGATFRVR
ncbi:MAG: hypothetical protein JNK45_13880 [Myxococcales bacterium]|jgi:hypothetical protein|nr:hypothetical protein [Myxococcales bacterium]